VSPQEPPPHTIETAAPAKVNLFLRVLGRRADGYHDLESLVVPISLADRLRVHAFAGSSFRTLSLSLDVSGDPALTSRVPIDETNLVLRAARALAEVGDVRGFAEFVLDKRVPVAGGLGGGSADAAAALCALNDLWSLGFTRERLQEVAATVGSDVPALVAGGPTLMRGRGERVAPAAVASLVLAVVPFSFGVSTADAFAWWDEDGGRTGPDPAAALAGLAPGGTPGSAAGALTSVLHNDLEESVVRRHAAVGEVRDRLLEGGAAAALMTGSGPTVVAVLPAGRTGLDAATERELEAISGRPVAYTGTSWAGA
jgi:4-diphosphocytidyl-2-C-methyl-D-erythritol kinase